MEVQVINHKPEIKNADDLKAAIAKLEQQKESDEEAVKHQFQDTLTSLKPVNLLKSTAKDFIRDDHWRGKMVTSAVGFGLGYLAKRTVVGRGASLGKKILGTLFKFGLKKAEANKSKIEDKASNLLKKIT